MKKRLLAKLLVLTMATTLFTGSNQAKEVKAADATSGLVANWKFDGDSSESVKGIKVESESNMKYETGIFGKAAVFNGKNSYIETSFDEALLLRNNFTMSFWANNNDAEGKAGTYLQMGKNCGWEFPGHESEFFSSPYTIWLEDGSNVNIKLSNEYINDSVENSESEYFKTKHVDAEEWFLFTVTYDGKTIKLYKDSMLLGQKSYLSGTNINPYGLLIGADEGLEYFYKGKMDDLKLFNRALSNDDVKALYTEGVKSSKELVEPSNKLVASYSFDGNTNDNSEFKNNGVKVEVSGSIKYVLGKNGKAVQLSKGNYIEIPVASQLNFDKTLTISYWLSVDKEGEFPVLYRQNPSIGGENANEYSYSAYVNQSYGNIITATMYDALFSPDVWMSAGTVKSNSENNTNGTLKSWHHYAFTIQYDENNDQLILKSYLDGKLKEKNTSDLTELLNASGSLLIGFDSNTFFTGAMDELQIYNYDRSATQINDEYKRVDSISLSTSDQKAIATIAKGKSVKITKVTLKDVDTGKTTSLSVSDKSLIMKSSNSKVVTVKNGTVTAVKKGSANLTITYGGVAKTYKMTVK